METGEDEAEWAQEDTVGKRAVRVNGGPAAQKATKGHVVLPEKRSLATRPRSWNGLVRMLITKLLNTTVIMIYFLRFPCSYVIRTTTMATKHNKIMPTIIVVTTAITPNG